MPEQLLSDRDVEKITRRARSTLQKDRVAGIGIPFVRFGRLVRYRQSDVEGYLGSLTKLRSTSEVDAYAEVGEVAAQRCGGDPLHRRRGRGRDARAVATVMRDLPPADPYPIDTLGAVARRSGSRDPHDRDNRSRR